MKFERKAAPKWHREVPGARWFKADLHLHTIDDHPGGKAKLPAGIIGEFDDPDVQRAYARRFLQRLVETGVQVAGLTPHSPRAGTGPESSATWRIVEEWNEGIDEDDIPFRDKVYAVFPGFEINVNDGAKGVHLMLLFDPEIGLDHYVRLFDGLMDGEEPWQGSSLKMTRKSAEEVFDTLDDQKVGEGRHRAPLEFLALAPHLLGEHGLQREMGPQVRDAFPLARLAGLGLPPGKLQADYNRAKKPGRYWLPRMQEDRQAFFHGSDAYVLTGDPEKEEPGIGDRPTWVKLARPRIEALRQAFLASDSRMREGLQKATDGSLVPIDDPPDAVAARRVWLRKVTVEGKASFFGVSGEGEEEKDAATFSFSPDLTCVIGGSMTGKSTLLDGLRVYTNAELPEKEDGRLSRLRGLHEQVEARGEKFRAASAKVRLDIEGGDLTAEASERWQAQFFAQNELQQLAQSDAAVDDILAKLDGNEAAGIAERRARLDTHDQDLARLAKEMNALDEELAEAEQAEAKAQRAKDELKAFEEAGVEDFHRLSRAHQNCKGGLEEARQIARQVADVTGTARSFDLSDLEATVNGLLPDTGPDAEQSETATLSNRWACAVAQLEASRDALQLCTKDIGKLVDRIGELEASRRTAVEQAMAASGYGSAELRRFQELDRQAALVPRYSRHVQEMRRRRDKKERLFAKWSTDRETLVEEQRAAFDRVIAGIAGRQGARIRGQRVEDGDDLLLEKFLKSLKQRGVTRWWDNLDRGVSPASLLRCLESDDLEALGMSPAVQKTFRETMTSARRRELAALRCRDRYVLELEVALGTYRPLSELSGGQRVSVLLTLMLATEDEWPLVIDQPEDELDNAFLFEELLPVLKALKGRRQVIVATHSANIVVNGDADMVIQLEATADRGRVACTGAIDDAAVREAIVQTVDGGQDAFRLRRRKYGF